MALPLDQILIQTVNGLVLLTPAGLAGQLTLSDIVLFVGDGATFATSTNGAALVIPTLSVTINNSTSAINETFAVDPNSAPVPLSVPAGPYFRLAAGTVASPLTLAVKVLGTSYALAGAFQIEQTTIGTGPVEIRLEPAAFSIARPGR